MHIVNISNCYYKLPNLRKIIPFSDDPEMSTNVVDTNEIGYNIVQECIRKGKERLALNIIDKTNYPMDEELFYFAYKYNAELVIYYYLYCNSPLTQEIVQLCLNMNNDNILEVLIDNDNFTWDYRVMYAQHMKSN